MQQQNWDKVISIVTSDLIEVEVGSRRVLPPCATPVFSRRLLELVLS